MPSPTPGVCVAPLDRDSLLAVLKPVLPADQAIEEVSVDIDDAGARAEYIIAPAQALAAKENTTPLNNYHTLRIHVCAPGGSAPAVMKGHADSFESTPPQPFKLPPGAKPLGDATPLGGGPFSVFWTRGESVFVNIVHCVEDPTTTKAVGALLLPLAAAIDAHVAAHWAADASKVVAPKAVLADPATATTAPIKVPAGRIFTVKVDIADPAAAHVVKRGDGGGVAVLTANGSREGLFTFLAVKEGKGRVRVRVADAKTFAATVVEAAVEVGPPVVEEEDDNEEED